MEPLVTQAELVRRITAEVLARLGGEPSAGCGCAAPKSPKAASAAGCGCGCAGGKSAVERAQESGFCELFSEPVAGRTLDRGYIPIGISARHCHVTQPQLEVLFGAGAQLEPLKPLKQTGQFAAKQTVTIVGPRGRAIERVRILGPCRNDTQVEVSLTDLIQLGLEAPVRPSGVHEGTPGILIVGPKGHLAIERGVIRANRHIHLRTDQAAVLKLKDQDNVVVKIDGDRPVVYFDVQVRVRHDFDAEMHLDTDDANAVGLGDGAVAQIVRNREEIPGCFFTRE